LSFHYIFSLLWIWRFTGSSSRCLVN
jgi:hypothetical protein